jgi:amino-acid N-acetyltransferase
VNFFRPTARAVGRLLTTVDLPTEDLPGGLEHFLGIGDPENPDGVVGLEIFGDVALLRSLVVARRARGRGLGKRLVAAAEERARQQAVHKVFLLTDTADAFFAALGYEPCDRELAPAPVRGTRQFSALCPASATLMVKELFPRSASRTKPGPATRR